MQIILGLTGYSCCGKGTFCKEIEKTYMIPRITIGDIVRKEVIHRGLELTATNIASVSDFIREETNNNFMSIAESFIRHSFSKNNIIIVDSLREVQDYFTLKKFAENVYIIAIITPREIRYQRMKERSRDGDPVSYESFCELEKKEKFLGIEKLIAKSNYNIYNDIEIKTFEEQSFQVVQKILNRHNGICQ